MIKCMLFYCDFSYEPITDDMQKRGFIAVIRTLNDEWPIRVLVVRNVSFFKRNFMLILNLKHICGKIQSL